MPPTVNYSHVPYYSMINPLLHCAASNTVDSQCLLISISMSVNTIPLSLQRNRVHTYTVCVHFNCLDHDRETTTTYQG